jgi:type IV pilus assembly protein PilB
MHDFGETSPAVATPPLKGITGLMRRLIVEKAIDEASARKAMEEAVKARTPITTYLLDKKLVSSADMALANAIELGMPLVDINTIDLKQCPIKLIGEDLLQQYKVLPLYKRGNRLSIAVADPSNVEAQDKIRFHSGLTLETVIIDREQLLKALDFVLNAGDNLSDTLAGDDALDLQTEGPEEDEGNATGMDANSEDTPVVKFINKVLIDAIKRGASDIHFEPYEEDYRVRFRLDGILKTMAKAPTKLNARLAARLKVMSSLDIAERRLPQDGRIKLNLSKTKQMDFRVSTCPTLFGEKVVLRILDGGAAKLGIDKLGYEDDQKDLYLKALDNPYGMILVTGPTGSGKTVSLYTGLNILNNDTRNISTAEDPVEIRVPGINQVQMNPKKGMTFAAALRSFLRQDPDVVMVGEIRDLETAEIAVKAAQTGHLVLSTLHTNDAPQTISRLMNMGIAPYNITSSVTLIIAQRLARRLCQKCKKPMDLPPKLLLEAGFSQEDISSGLTVFEAAGCPECNEGYKGRVGIYQVMPMTEEIQKIVLEGGNALQIAEVAKSIGICDLRQSALKKVKAGMTSLTEADRVTKS